MVVFPAVAISKNNSFISVSGLDELSHCTSTGWNSGYFKDLTLLDSEGSYWEVKAEIDHQPKLWERILNRRIKVGINFQYICDGKEKAVEDICLLLDKDTTDLYDQFVSKEELKTEFTKAQSAKEIVHLATTLGYEDNT